MLFLVGLLLVVVVVVVIINYLDLQVEGHIRDTSISNASRAHELSIYDAVVAEIRRGESSRR